MSDSESTVVTGKAAASCKGHVPSTAVNVPSCDLVSG